jgi:hypothetical protein
MDDIQPIQGCDIRGATEPVSCTANRGPGDWCHERARPATPPRCHWWRVRLTGRQHRPPWKGWRFKSCARLLGPGLVEETCGAMWGGGGRALPVTPFTTAWATKDNPEFPWAREVGALLNGLPFASLLSLAILQHPIRGPD